MSNQFMSTFLVVFNYLNSDLIKKQRTFKIGLITIFLVVFFTSLLLNTINLSSLIFLRLAENQAGETDLIMIPYLNKKDVKYKRSALDKLFANNQDLEKAQHNNSSFSESFKLIDFPEVRKKLMNEPFIKGVSPRWIFPINVSYHNLWATSNLVILNSRVENQYEFGRKINLPDLNYLVNIIKLGMLC